MLNKSNLLSFMTNFNKNLKINFCWFLTPLLCTRSLALGWKVQLCCSFFINLYLFDYNFLGIARINMLLNFVEEILNNGCYRNGKKTLYFRYNSNSCKEDKIIQKHESCTFELPLIKLS